MSESFNDALTLLADKASDVLAEHIGETRQTTERAINESVHALGTALQRRLTDSEFMDEILFQLDDYRRTAVNGGYGTAGAGMDFSPAAISAGDRLTDDILGADRIGVTARIADESGLHPSAAAYVMNAAAALMLQSLERQESQALHDPEPSPARVPDGARGDAFSALTKPAAPGRADPGRADPGNDATINADRTRSRTPLQLVLAAAIIAGAGVAWRFADHGRSSNEIAATPASEASAPGGADVEGRSAGTTGAARVEEAPATQEKESAAAVAEDARKGPPKDASAMDPQAERAAAIGKASPPPARNAAASAAGAGAAQLKLPTGVELAVSKSGVEESLFRSLQDVSIKSGEFVLDRISFDAGKTTVNASSAPQLQNLATILNAYPNVTVTISAFTDNVGNTANNLKLSRQRANAVLQELERKGVDRSRMSAIGFGADRPVASNSSEDGRKQNRRISLKFKRP